MNRLACAGLLVASLFSLGAAEPAEKPNVLFIAIDDLNDWIGCLGGHPDVKTPNLDRLAARGVLFTRAYCASPSCNPSRAALLTGIRPSTSGVYTNSQPWRPAMPDAVTIPQHFKANGYTAVGGGKIFHGRYPDEASWDFYFRKRGDPKPEKLPANGIPKTAHFDWGPVENPDEDMDDYKVTTWAVDELKKNHEKPFFIAYGLFRPHLPWYAPKKYFDLYPLEKIKLPTVDPNDLEDVPEAGRKMARPDGDHKKVVESDNWRRAVQGYLASVTFTDVQLGRVLDALDGSPYRDNTVIVLWGDHGWHLGEKLHWRKFALWEEATKAPLMFVAPGVTRPGGRCARTVDFMDVYPTLVELCGLPEREELEGKSLVPLLRDPSAEWNRPAVTTYGRQNHTVRSERWRYIRYRDGSEELYDHDVDPMERKNLAPDSKYDAIKKDLAAWLPGKNAPDAPSTRRKKKK